MNLNQLAYFRVVCEAGSISAAAERLYIARPSLSSSIGALERELGVSLLERGKTGVVPTEAGSALLECVVDCESRLTACLRRIGDIGQGEHRRTLRFGLVGGTLDPQIIARLYSYEERCASVAVELVNRGCPDFWHAVEEGEIDLAVTVRPPAVGTGVEAVRIGRLDQSLVVHRANPVAMFGLKRGWVDFTHDMPGCTLLETEGRLDPYLDLLKSLGIQRKMVGEDRGFIRQLIAHDRGCVLTISGLVERYMCDEACVLPVRGIPPEMDLDPYLVFRPNPDEEIRGFANHALECLGSAAQLDS